MNLAEQVNRKCGEMPLHLFLLDQDWGSQMCRNGDGERGRKSS
jgi:hypothetical protein